MVIDSTSKSIEVLLSSSPLSNQAMVYSAWADNTTTSFTPGETDILSNGTTAVSAVPSPASSTQRHVKYLNIYNNDTAVVTAIVRFNNSGNLRILAQASIQPGQNLQWTPDQGFFVSGYVPGPAIASNQNLLINGDLSINQRVFSGGSLSINTYGYDMFRTGASSASITSTTSSITLNGTIFQVIDSPSLQNSVVTVSAKNPSGPITVNLQPDAVTSTSATGVIPAGSGWRSVTLTVPGTLTGNIYALFTTSSPTTIDGSGNRGGFRIEVGSAVSQFDRRPPGMELLMCQRSYEKSYEPNLAPGSISNLGSSQLYAGALTLALQVAGESVYYKTAKRAIPSIITYSPVTGTSGKVRDLVNATDVNTNLTSIGSNGYFCFATVPLVSTGYNFQWQWTADASA